MNFRFFTHWILVVLIGMSLISESKAQTITTGTLSVSQLCIPASLSVPFTKTGNFNGNNIFTVELSGPTGSFSTPRVLTPTNNNSPLVVTIPADVAVGSGYQVRVVSSNPKVTGATSATVLTLQQAPAAPTVTTTAYSYCTGTTALPLSATASGGNTLQWYDGGGNSLASAPVPPTTTAGTQTYSVAQVTSAGCTSPKVSITVNIVAPPAAPTVSAVSLCQGAGAAALTASGANLLWYAAATGGTGSATAPTPATATAGTTSYYVSQSVNGCEGPRAKLDVTVTARPAPPAVTASLTYCFGQSVPPLTATGSGLKWFDASDAPLAGAPTPSNTAGSSYKVSQTVSGCESDRATITVNINQTPAPAASASTEYCAGQTAAALTATGTDLKWYAAAAGGAALAGAPTPATATPGSTNYFVSQTLNGCESSRTQLTVVVKPVPAAPTVSAVSLCQGAGASALTAGGSNLLWYAAASGGTGSATAPTPATATAGTTSYYVSQSVNGCESPRAKLDVTVTARPAPPTVAASLTYCFGQSVPPLTATGSGLKWFDASDAPLAGAPTPSNTAGSSYKVSQTVNGCESDRATITVNITQTPAPTASIFIEYCVGQTAAALTATGTDLKWYATAASVTPLASAPVPSTATATLLEYYVSQTLKGCESDRIKITVLVKSVPAAPATAPISLCENSTTPALTATGSNLIWYREATGGSGNTNAPVINTVNPGSTSYYVTQTVNGCESPRAKLDVTIKSIPAVPTVTASIPYCIGTTPTTLTATGTGLKWFDAQGNSLPSAPTPSTTSAGSTTYQVSQTTDGCESPKATITVTVYKTNVPAVTSPVEYCNNELAVPLVASGTALKWYDSSTGGTASTTTPIPSTATVKTTAYYVTQTQNNCESDRVRIDVLVKAIPAAPTTVAVPAVCQSGPSLSLLSYVSNATGSLSWYTSATGGSASSTAPIPSTANAGSTTYYVSQTVNSCESPRSTLTQEIKALPPLPLATTPINLCVGGSTQPLTATGTGLKWYDAQGNSLLSAPTPSTTSAGSTNYKVSQTANGCESPLTTITVTVYDTKEPGVVTPTVEYCNNETATTLTATGTALKWYTSATGGTASPTAPTPSTATVGTASYYVTQTLNNCEGPRALIKVLVKAIPAAPVTAAVPAVCQLGTSLILLGFIDPGTKGPLQWYTSATGGSASSAAPVPPTETAGSTTYYVTQTVNGCESPRAPLTQEVKALPGRPSATALVDLCEKGPAQPLSATGENLKWYSTASGGNSSTTAPTPGTAVVTTTSFYVSQTAVYPIAVGSLACEGPRAKIDVQVNPLPGLPSVTPPQAICQDRQDRSVSFSASGENLKWYSAASGGSAVAGTPSLNLKEPQETSYYVSQTTAKGCEGSRAEVKIRVKRLPALPGVTPSIEYCQFDKPNQLTATPETNAMLNWYGTSASGGTPSGVAPTPTTDTGGTTSFYVSQTLEGCEGDRRSINVLVKTTARPGVTTPVEYCQNVTAQPLAAQGSRLKWYREPSATESQTTPFTPFTANVGAYAFYVTQTGDNGCESPKEKIDVRIKPLPSATISGDNSISLGQSAEILVTFTGDGPWDFTLSNNLAMKGVTQNPQRITVTPERTTTYTVTEVANACGKGIPNGSAMVTVRIPTISTGNPTIANLCAGTSFTLPFQASGDFVAANKFNVQISLTEADASFRSIPTVQQGSDAIATVPDSIPGGNYFVRVVGESPQLVIKGSVSPVTVTVKPRPTATLTGSTTILIGETTTLNIAFTGDGPWTFRFNNGIRDSLITTSITSYVLEVKPGATTTYTISSVSNQCGTGKISGTARIQVDPILGTEPTFSTVWLKVYPSPVQTMCVVEMDTPLVGGEARLQVYDTKGRTVFIRKLNSSRTDVDFSAQPAGLYFLKIENGGRTAVRRIFKQN